MFNGEKFDRDRFDRVEPTLNNKETVDWDKFDRGKCDRSRWWQDDGWCLIVREEEEALDRLGGERRGDAALKRKHTHTHTHIHAVCGERLSTLFAVGVCANKTNLFHGKICTHQGEWRGFTLLRWPPAWNPNQFCWCHTTLVSTCRKQSLAHRHVGVGLSVTFPLKEIQVKSYSVTPQN